MHSADSQGPIKRKGRLDRLPFLFHGRAMIVSASYRSDIPAYYGDWFRRRLAAGFASVVNPYGGPPYRVSLAPADADGFVFWTRNVAPFLGALDDLHQADRPFLLHFTITGYPRALEAAVIDTDRAIAQARAVAARFGARRLVWRYDPIALSSLTPTDFHRANFSRLAKGLRGACDEVVVSFVQPYRKMLRNMRAAALQHGFTWNDPEIAVKRQLLRDLAQQADAHGMRLTLCTQPDLESPDIPAARCIDAGRLAAIAGRPIRARQKGNRPGCACAESRDIGAFDSCAQGCTYCYAVSSRTAAHARLKPHDPAGAFLFPP